MTSTNPAPGAYWASARTVAGCGAVKQHSTRTRAPVSYSEKIKSTVNGVDTTPDEPVTMHSTPAVADAGTCHS